MKQPSAILLCVLAFWAATAMIVVVFMLGDDTPDCTPAGSTAPTSTTPATNTDTVLVGDAKPAPAPGPVASMGSRVWPVAPGSYEISDVFGSRGGSHKGVDLAAPAGTPIYAAMDGVVAESGPASGFGEWIVLDHNDNGAQVGTVYGHMYAQDLLVHAGDQVKAGQQISRVGSNGESTGAHLHFEVYLDGGRLTGGHAVDPVPWLDGASAPSGQGEAAKPVAPPCPTTPGGGVDNLQPGKVPPDFEPWYRKAGALCPQISSSLLAAQGRQEGGWSPDGGAKVTALSETGAQGPAQFMPGTWQSWGTPVDEQGNPTGPPGTGDVHKPSDAIMAQGRFMCHIAEAIDGWIASGQVTWSGDRRVLYLAGYNAGEGAVLASGGFPSGHSDYEVQTRPYADNILAMEPEYRALV
ncbi:peptidoglycan DD-metalloendopeptidase family protein [Nocardia jejuensis]|uniref:peptidoglycan DD-metalloendopeptidase family protein n=1 Tax=Nocardia jejuensis TaxID=328049 RepID=UPI00082C2F72|nr:M23 family metallopeptidase [Nocardia jejuensis]